MASGGKSSDAGGTAGAALGGGGASQAGSGETPEPPWVEPPTTNTRCASAPIIVATGLPSCALGDETVLDNLALSRPIAFDDQRVYYVGDPPLGAPCPSSNDCSSVLSVPKVGGDVRVHGPAFFTGEIAVDDQFVYWSDQSLNYAPKQGGNVQTTTLQPDGFAVTGGFVYAANRDSSPWSLERIATPLTTTRGDIIALLPDLIAYPARIVTDGESAYLVVFATSPAQPLYAVHLSDGKPRVLDNIDVARGIALGGQHLYVSEEMSQSVVSVDLSDGTVTALCFGGIHPYALAADEDHIYLNAQALGADSKYTGQLVRVATDGSGACVVAPSLDFSSAPAVDDQYLYWASGRLLHKLPKQ